MLLSTNATGFVTDYSVILLYAMNFSPQILKLKNFLHVSRFAGHNFPISALIYQFHIPCDLLCDLNVRLFRVLAVHSVTESKRYLVKNILIAVK